MNKRMPVRHVERPVIKTEQQLAAVFQELQSMARELKGTTSMVKTDILRQLCIRGQRLGLEPQAAEQMAKKILGYGKVE